MTEAQPSTRPPIEDERRIDKLCDEFERKLRNGESPKIEDYLDRLEQPLRRFALAELIALELEILSGECEQLEGYLARFPDDTGIIRAAFQRAFPGNPIVQPIPSTNIHLAKTEGFPPNKQPPAEKPKEPIPKQVGRYEIRRVLGEGGYGRVYLAHDPSVNRAVALKVPNQKLFDRGVSLEAFIQEARNAALVEHPAIVTIYDVQQEGRRPYIVQQYIDGHHLGQWVKRGRPTHQAVVRLLIEIAEAIGFAHQRGLVHRDLKPSNILIDSNGNAYVADFGLAVHESVRRQRKGEVAGTPQYMSPEQVRGETHRLDGRTDIWSLGVIFYELLLGERPFTGKTRDEVYDEIEIADPLPLRQRNPEIPKELERICLKSLEKRRSDRYSSAADLIDDLRHWLDAHPQKAGEQPHPTSPPQANIAAPPTPDSPLPTPDSPLPTKIIPKGLRSFDENDADFFLELLPGPRDREGLPESIRFWKTRIEQTDADKTFSVGLIYGPSGCGKSSLVKAGLLPRLARHVCPVYVEATAEDTEVRLLKGLNKQIRASIGGLSLPDALCSLRERGQGDEKVLIILDQFEQWLHARAGQTSKQQLVDALRQCDGQHLQCMVMVRDDFWLAVSRFFRQLDVPLLEGRNIALADMFDLSHAQKVLTSFGQAFGKLPENHVEISNEQQHFVEQAAQGLAKEGKVICVRLALLAEMMKGKTWTTAALKEAGGAEGIGVTFLEEAFSASTASPQHRLHQKAARKVLKALLPESGADIKGNMKSYDELLEASGYTRRPDEFAELLRILDGEIRLITPTDPESVDDAAPSADAVPEGKHYQLTHDYLVPSLRQWLTRKQKETRQGRAELRLAERSATWCAKPENRHLPSWREYGNIRLFTRKKNWTEPQARMMSKAARVHGLRWGSALLVALLIGFSIQRLISSSNRRNLLERTETAVASMSTSHGVLVPRDIENLKQLPRQMVVAELCKQFATDDESRKLSLAYALAHYGQVEVDFLAAQVEHASPPEAANFIAALDKSNAESVSALQEFARRAGTATIWRYKARLAILALHLKNPSLAREMCQLQPNPIQRTVFIEECSVWHGDLAALAQQLTETKDGPLCSAIALAVGNVAVEELTSPEKQTWEKVLSNWFQQKTDTTTHSAAGWALRKWKLAPPKIDRSKEPAQGFDWRVNSLGMTMLRILEGRFTREVTVTDPKDRRKRNTIQQEVTISRSFLISDREVTRSQFQRFMDDPNYSAKEKPKDWRGATETYSPTEKHPVQSINWYDAILFCNWLSQKEGLKPCYERTGEKDAWRLNPEADGYRLPTEAEWEYACRAGTTTRYSYGNDESFLDRYAVFRAIRTEIPGSNLPNGWGLFDMHGNVWEWCHDWYGNFSTEPSVVDPMGPEQGRSRVLRGGSFLNLFALNLRTANRSSHQPHDRYLSSVGFRPARTYP